MFGVSGAMRCSELVDLCFDDIEKENGSYKISIKSSKTDPAGKGYSFWIKPNPVKSKCFCDIISRYIDKFSVHERVGRFFRKFGKNGPTQRPIGINKVSAYPQEVANSLSLTGRFTRHCWRRSSCLLYTSPSPRDKRQSRMPSSA